MFTCEFCRCRRSPGTRWLWISLLVFPAMIVTPTPDAGARSVCGDANGDGRVNIMDVCFIASYVWLGGTPPDPYEAADVNGDGGVNVGDQQFLMRSIAEPWYPDISCPPLPREGKAGIVSPEHTGPDRALGTSASGDSRYGNYLDIDLAPKDLINPAETAYVGGNYEFRIWIENSAEVFGLSMGFYAWAGDAVDWSWVGQPFGFGNPAFITGEPDSRLYFGWYFNGATWTNPGPGTEIGMAGASILSGFAPGPLEHMLSLHFRVDSLRYSGDRMICIDSVLWGRYDGDLVFAYQDGSGVYPEALWPQGGRCWPVAIPPCGDANSDGSVNVGDAVYIISFVFKSGPPPTPYCVGEANGDGDTNVGDAVYLVNYVFKNGLPPIKQCCPYTR